jgi:hypothetical protein
MNTFLFWATLPLTLAMPRWRPWALEIRHSKWLRLRLRHRLRGR